MRPTAGHLQVGALLGNKYRIEALLGQGGMGAVYLAENLDIGRKVAIKILHPDFAADPQTVQRFRMEARAAAAIGHPGIVDVLDLGATDDGAQFIVMERLVGETLGARIRRLGQLPTDEAVTIVSQLLEALAVAHQKGIVHRDLKPENVFLVEEPVPHAKILDFGISKFSGADGEDLSVTQSGAVMGTPLYMSPEQARNAKDIGPATDLYAVGVILYMALAGKPPIGGDGYAEVIANVLTAPHRPLILARPDVLPAISSAVDRLLVKDPAARPPNALAVRDELRLALDTQAASTLRAVPVPLAPDVAPAVSAVGATSSLEERPRSRAPTSPLRVVIVLTVTGLATVAVWWLASQRGLPPPARPVVAPPAVAPPVVAPSPALTVELRLRAEPASATWQLDGIPLGCNPCALIKEAGSRHVAVATLAGYSPSRLELLFDHARDQNVHLDRPTPPAVRDRHPHPAPPTAPTGPLSLDKTNPF